MVDMRALERQLADESLRIVGPEPVVDDAAILTAIAATRSPERRFQHMFSATRFVVAGAIVALFGGLLLAGVSTPKLDDAVPAAAVSPSAPADAVDPEISSRFSLRMTGYRVVEEDGSPEGDVAVAGSTTITGLALEAKRRLSDPRALGSVTEAWTWYFDRVNAVIVGRGSTRVENDGGTWVGSAQRYSIGDGVEIGTAIWELVGEGGYAGLTMFLWGDFSEGRDIELTGVIVPSDSVPGPDAR